MTLRHIVVPMTISTTRDRRKRDARHSPRAADLLAWYDGHRRTLPWRAGPGEPSDPYRVWLSEIMLQQTTVKAVTPYFARFIARWPTVEALASAPLDEVLRLWAGLGYYARARNLHACAQAVVRRHGGQFPATEAELLNLPGIGPYSSSAIAAIAFDRPVAAVDGNVQRVIGRLFAVERPLPEAREDIRRLAQSLVPDVRAGDFAQALMDLGAMLCRPKNPACEMCPWSHCCAARQRRSPERFPNKPPRALGMLRRGAAFVALRRDGMVLVRTRPHAGLLGGMTEVPTTEWSPGFPTRTALAQAPRLGPRVMWRRVPGTVTHAFTHFPLVLTVYTAEINADVVPPDGLRWVPRSALDGEALPSVMHKVFAHALEQFRRTPK